MWGCSDKKDITWESVSSTESTTTGEDIPVFSGSEDDIIDSDLMAPYGCKIATISDDGIEVYWKHPEDSSGYEIYRAYDGGDYSLLADLEDWHTWSYFDTDFDEGRDTIYYLVRNYVTQDDGTRVYSEFCDVIKASYIKKIRLNRKLVHLPSGEHTTIEAYHGWKTVHDAVWSTDNTDVAVIDQDGILTGIGQGECTLTCESESAGYSTSITVTIDRPATEMLSDYTSRYTEVSEDYWVNENASDTGDAVIMVLGDLMSMSAQQNAGMDDNGEFKFNESYDYVRDFFSTADLVIGNLETEVDSAYSYYCEETTVKHEAQL